MYPSVQRKPMVHGLLEVDVTKVRAFLRDHKAKTGESLSFTAFIATCLARAVGENKSLEIAKGTLKPIGVPFRKPIDHSERRITTVTSYLMFMVTTTTA